MKLPRFDTLLVVAAIGCLLWFGYATSRSPEPKVVVQVTNVAPAVVEPPVKDISDDGHWYLQGIFMKRQEQPVTEMQMYEFDFSTMKFTPSNHISFPITNSPSRHTTVEFLYLGGSNILIDLSHPTRPMR